MHISGSRDRACSKRGPEKVPFLHAVSLRRDGLRIEYDRMKIDLGLSKKTKQVDVLRKAVAELQVSNLVLTPYFNAIS